ncbi:dihydropteroate synthase [Rhodovulum adriaticum]|uniref:Dihydropteroate synthase n=1 Tax=Rhodovulum adriaticum TaxID=35804 RepID=A0A4R2NJQ5_RHOAD|nr:dihydropteroate synthase [Rhodovulum adriaticum]MBK1634709.1 dihydropteroate synthase [Rhodovulum adriaticum]TCP21582.1 dihydropteroate synthase [Rhodovulum adriaticum]
MRRYFRPIVQNDPARPSDALPIAGGWAWFTRAEELSRDGPPRIIPAHSIPFEERAALTAPRPAVAGLTMDRPRIMGILNVTPDSFSDGGRFDRPEAALAQGRALAVASDILDIGGESTRPGAAEVPLTDEIARTAPVIEALRAAGLTCPISIDTRKAPVAEAALAAGAGLVNDVSGFDFDPALAGLVARAGVPVCVMHAQGTPETMQADPRYDNVLLDIYDALAERIARAQAAGIPRSHIVVDPGIGFGKTVGHNLALLRGLSLFHGLGCPILLGASRKSFIGMVSGEEDAARRAPGSIAVALAAMAQGVQILRVHDAAETRQALRVDLALKGVDSHG